MHAAGGADIDERHDGGMLALLEGADLAAGDADVPHAAARQHLDGVPLVVGLVVRLVNRPHAAGAEGVHERERAEDEALRLALQQAFGLEAGQDILGDEEFGQGGRFGTRVFLQEFADDLIEPAAVDQVAAAQIPDKPFAGAKFSRNHCCILLKARITSGTKKPRHGAAPPMTLMRERRAGFFRLWL